MKNILGTSLCLVLFTLFASVSHAGGKHSAVKKTIVTMVNAIDSKEWALAEAQFADELFVDYSSLNNQPGANAKASDLVGGWKSLLQNVSTHHMLTNFEITVNGKKAESVSHVYASHAAEGIDSWVAYGRYKHSLEKQGKAWKITSMTLIMHGQTGNEKFIEEVLASNAKRQKVSFQSEGNTLVGNLYLPPTYDASKQYPAIVVSGSWTTVKEQMAGTYAEDLAKEGFITLAFDFSNFGESEGEPRFFESPALKVKDVKNAVSYLASRSDVSSAEIGAFGVCAGAMYTLMAAAEDKRIQAVATAASWLHDAEAVKLFYGGEEGVQAKVDAAKQAKAKYKSSGEVEYIPTISTTDASAAMYGPYDYYLNPERGAIKAWSADKFAVMSWEDWLTTDPMTSAEALTAPTMMIHSDGAVLPNYTKKYFERIASKDKKLHWMETELQSPFHQFNYYDQSAEVNEVVAKSAGWFKEHF